MIKSDVEFEAKFEELRRFYRATRHESSKFSHLPLTNELAAQLIKMTRPLVARITQILSEIENYTGATVTRGLCLDMDDVRDRRIQKDKE